MLDRRIAALRAQLGHHRRVFACADRPAPIKLLADAADHRARAVARDDRQIVLGVDAKPDFAREYASRLAASASLMPANRA